MLSISYDFELRVVDCGSIVGPSVDDQAVSLSDNGTTIIIDFFSFLFFFLPPLLKSQKGLS